MASKLEKDKRRKLVTLSEEDWAWMEKHPELKASALLHQAIVGYKFKLGEIK